MRKKIIFLLSILVSNIFLIDTQARTHLLIIHSNDDTGLKVIRDLSSTSLMSAEILNFNLKTYLFVKDENGDDDQVENLIQQLRLGFGENIKIEHVSSDDIKKGTQDGEWGK